MSALFGEIHPMYERALEELQVPGGRSDCARRETLQSGGLELWRSAISLTMNIIVRGYTFPLVRRLMHTCATFLRKHYLGGR